MLPCIMFPDFFPNPINPSHIPCTIRRNPYTLHMPGGIRRAQKLPRAFRRIAFIMFFAHWQRDSVQITRELLLSQGGTSMRRERQFIDWMLLEALPASEKAYQERITSHSPCSPSKALRPTRSAASLKWAKDTGFLMSGYHRRIEATWACTCQKLALAAR